MRYRLSTGPWPTTLDVPGGPAMVTRPIVVTREMNGAPRYWLVKVMRRAHWVPITWGLSEDPQPTRAARDEGIAAKLEQARMAWE